MQTLKDVMVVLLWAAFVLFLALSFPPDKRPEWKGYNEIKGEHLRQLGRGKR